MSVAVLGSSGSIGTQTLDIVRAEPENYRVAALGVARSVESVIAQAEEFRPDLVAVADETQAADIGGRLPTGTELLVGPGAMPTAKYFVSCKEASAHKLLEDSARREKLWDTCCGYLNRAPAL